MPAGNTYEAIATTTVSGTTTQSVTFSSIPSTYTDLVLVYSAKTDTSDTDMLIQFNGDTGSNYSNTIISGTGASALSGRGINQTFIYCDSYGAVTTTSYNVAIINLNNYANTTTNKTMISRSNNAGLGVDAVVGLWRSTAAINSITLDLISTRIISAGSVFSLYGIKAA